MATGMASDFVIYEEEFYAGMNEVLQQNANVFNDASANAIRLEARKLKGDFESEAFFQELTNLATRRDTASVAAVADTPMTQAERVAVKLNRKLGPIGQTMDAWRKIGYGTDEFSLRLGEQVGQAVAVDYVNSAILAAATASVNEAGLYLDSKAATLNHNELVKGLALFGDKASRIGAFVMHSKVYYDLMGQSITDKITDVAGVTVNRGTVATLGKPVIVTDSVNLVKVDGIGVGVDSYYTLGLVQGGVVVTESEEREIMTDKISGQENIIGRVQGEYAFNLGLKGFAWDKANGGANPTDAALAVATNWDRVATDLKACFGFAAESA